MLLLLPHSAVSTNFLTKVIPKRILLDLPSKTPSALLSAPPFNGIIGTTVVPLPPKVTINLRQFVCA